MWTLIPLGNPGTEYANTRHNLGRLLLLRWMSAQGIQAKVLREFHAGTLYCLAPEIQALVPATYMNLSGQVLGEALAAGLDPARMIALHDDKDLPLGLGRFRAAGSAGGHNGMDSLLGTLGTEDLARLRLGIGPFTRPLHEFVLGEWNAGEWKAIAGLDGPFAAFLERLVETGNPGELSGRVNSEAFWAIGPPT
jgi:PTH1 family peptidyl-tRNA hydrolase